MGRVVGRIDTTLTPPTDDVEPLSSLRFAPDGAHIVAGSSRGAILEWALGTDHETTPVELKLQDEGPSSAVTAVDISPDGSLVACGSRDQTVRVWKLDTHELVATLRGHNGSVNAIAFSPDGKRLTTAGQDSVVILWDTSDWSVCCAV